MINNFVQWLNKCWKYFRNLQEYKWERGSSCCMPGHHELNENPFSFREESAGSRGHHEHTCDRQIKI